MTTRVSSIVTNDQINRIIQIESAGNPKAKASTSTAKGLGQFLNGTWLEELKQHRTDLFNGPPYDDEFELGKDPALQIEILIRFTEDNAKVLGPGFHDGDLYLAHFSGLGVARKLLRAPQADPVGKYYSKSAINANRSILLNKDGTQKTVGQVRNWANWSMINRWDKAGRPDWIKKYYKGGPMIPLPRDHPKALDDDDNIDADINLKRTGTNNDVGKGGNPFDPENPPTTSDNRKQRLLNIQRRLKAMNYNPGGLDGLWGGMTAGAIAGFLNDRGSSIAPPTSSAEFDATDLEHELTAAEAEGFKRPVSEERANADAKKVEQTAPEVIPVRRNFFTALWAGVVTFFTAMLEYIKDGFVTLFGFVSEHKDDVPEEARSGLFSVLTDIPPTAWVVVVLAALSFVGYNAWRSMQRITQSVQTGERQ